MFCSNSESWGEVCAGQTSLGPQLFITGQSSQIKLLLKGGSSVFFLFCLVLVPLFMFISIICVIRFRLLSGHFWERVAHLVDHMVILYFDCF